MPELPEVETIKLGLERKIIGLKIKNIEAVSARSFLGNSSKLQGKIVLNVWRRAKILGIDLSDNLTLLFHLKMTGQLVLVKSEQRIMGGHPTPDMVGPLPNSHTRVIIEFSDKSKLFFNDQRRFGWVKVSSKSEVKSEKFLEKLGPEPLEKGFTWQLLKENLLKHKSMPVKVAIMDQTVVAGVGNIYASEACFNAKLDPKLKVKDLNDEQFQRLHKGVIKSLKDGLKYGGSTRAHFVDAEGHKGYFLYYAFVYGLDKHPCKICGHIIQKMQLGGRGTYFCSRCQK